MEGEALNQAYDAQPTAYQQDQEQHDAQGYVQPEAEQPQDTSQQDQNNNVNAKHEKQEQQEVKPRPGACTGNRVGAWHSDH
jgi:hypothetical protein